MMNLISLIMVFKLGIFPFTFWLYDIIEGLSWESIIIFFTAQKIIPFYTLRLMDFYLIEVVIIFTGIIGIFGIINQLSLRKFLVFSSIVHLV